jgi:hypothetical protein
MRGEAIQISQKIWCEFEQPSFDSLLGSFANRVVMLKDAGTNDPAFTFYGEDYCISRICLANEDTDHMGDPLTNSLLI